MKDEFSRREDFPGVVVVVAAGLEQPDRRGSSFTIRHSFVESPDYSVSNFPVLSISRSLNSYWVSERSERFLLLGSNDKTLSCVCV